MPEYEESHNKNSGLGSYSLIFKEGQYGYNVLYFDFMGARGSIIEAFLHILVLIGSVFWLISLFSLISMSRLKTKSIQN